MIVKLATWMVMPMTLLLLALLLAVWRLHRHEPRASLALLFATVVLAVLATPMAGFLLERQLEQRVSPPPAAARAELGIVLGGMLSPPTVRGGYPDLHGSMDRAWVAADLVRRGRLRRLLLVGGNQPGDSADLPAESEVVRDILIGWGVPASRISIETRSSNTRENAQQAAALLASSTSPPWLLTSGWHMPRAMLEFRCAGITVQPFPVETDALMPQGPLAWLPSADALSRTSAMLKEWLGLTVASWRCQTAHTPQGA